MRSWREEEIDWQTRVPAEKFSFSLQKEIKRGQGSDMEVESDINSLSELQEIVKEQLHWRRGSDV